MTRDEALVKIQKLLRLGKDSGATEAEALRALAQAEKLMRMHDISEAEATVRKLNAGAIDIVLKKVDVCYNDVGFGARMPSWVGIICQGVGKAYDTRVWIEPHWIDGKVEQWLAIGGVHSDVMMVEYLAVFLVTATYRASQRFPGSRSEKSDFRTGMAARLQARLYAMKAERTKPQEGEAKGAGTGLMVLSDAKQVALRERFKDAGDGGKQVKTRLTSAYFEGSEAGSKVSLNRPLNDTREGREALV